MSVLQEIPAHIRKALYVGLAIVGIALGGTQAAFLAMDDAATPTWLKGALAAYGFVATALGITASSNIHEGGDTHA